MHGANAPDTILEVPVGTVVTDMDDGSVIVDLTKHGQTYSLCEGGRGGFGNSHFSSSTRQAPNFAELGDTGDVREVKLELKLVADVGLVGLPNAGKSTVIQSITNVRPKIANYAFTTLIPNLGVMEWKDRALVIEDVPGLIEGASEGKGLGFQFLKHIERCRIIIHLIDASVGEEEMIQSYRVIRQELENWSEEMGEKEELIVFSKSELVDSEHLEEMVKYFEKTTKKKVALTISA
jgi:GTPase